MIWRWDQGRLEYFKYDNLVRIAHALSELSNTELRTAGDDPLRVRLTSRTGLPFAPTHYRVWRNYGRVFACALLATSINNKLTITDICRRLSGEAGAPFTVDEYLSLFIHRFSYPFPAFQDYNTQRKQVFPICTVIRFLLARHANGLNANITLDEVFAYLIGNNCTGTEDIEDYIHLSKTNRVPRGDENRQVRELLIFCSQLNLLKWFNNTLFLDIDERDEETFSSLLQLATPIPYERDASASTQMIRMSTIRDADAPIVPVHTRENPSDLVFTEGRRVRVSHLRTERSPRLRRIYFDAMQPPYLCDMCRVDLDTRYPWTTNMLELHHLLPLSSAVAIDSRGTSLVDVEPLCPNCHKSVHVYYGNHFRSNQKDDFVSKDEARYVYSEAKRVIGV